MGIIPISTRFLDSFSHANEPIPIPIAKVASNRVVIVSFPLIVLRVRAGICNVTAEAKNQNQDIPIMHRNTSLSF